jgi:hypothetical protein
MSDDQRERRGPFVGCLAVGLLLGLPAYVLSIGPAARLLTHYRDDYPVLANAIRGFYWPLGFLFKHSETFARIVGWYQDLWQ